MMDAITRQCLNQLNREFYRITATEFDATQGVSWPGWEQVLRALHDYIALHNPAALRVLDVGCGNGRFGLFLAEHLDIPITYHGVDNSAELLARARLALASQANLSIELHERDILAQDIPDDPCDLVALFGVMHHIPGAVQRQALVNALVARAKPGGLVAFSTWRFYEFERFRKRIVPWPEGITVETHDYLLDWRRGERALRYCHYVDDAEHQALAAHPDVDVLATYRADGFTGAVNAYSILRRR